MITDMIKKKDTNNFVKHLALPVLLTVILLGGLILVLRSNNQANPEVTPTPDITAEEKIEEEIKDGVYTNYTYGFQFEYDNLFFDTSNPWEGDWKRFFSKGGSELRILRDNSEYQFNNYEQCLNTDSGDKIKRNTDEGTVIKRYQVVIEDVLVCVQKSNPEGIVDGGASFADQALFELDGSVFRISLIHSSDLETDNYSNMLDLLVSRLIFLR